MSTHTVAPQQSTERLTPPARPAIGGPSAGPVSLATLASVLVGAWAVVAAVIDDNIVPRPLDVFDPGVRHHRLG